MSEFNNRISLQRTVIKITNSLGYRHQLVGISSKAIDRWVIDNKIDPKSKLVVKIKEISGQLFFLANKSQEQITESYRKLSNIVSHLVDELKEEVEKMLNEG